MSTADADRIVIARSMMWDAATSDEQADWLRAADRCLTELARAASRPAAPASNEEGERYPRLRSLP